MPDLIAEYEAYRTEQARYVREGRKDRAAEAGKEADRVAAVIGVEAEKFAAQADNHVEAGQDLLAARALIEAKRLRRALADVAPGDENAADSTPRDTAVTKKRSGNA